MKPKKTTTVLVISSTDRSAVTRRFPLTNRFDIYRLLIGIILASAASLAWADDTDRIASLVNQMRTGQAELSALKSEQNDLTAQSESNLKELNAYKSSFGQLEAEKKAAIANSPALKDAKRRLQSADDMVEEWNKLYAKDRVGLLDEATYNEGARRKPQVERTVNAIRADVKSGIAKFYEAQIAPIEATQKKQQKAMDELAARIKSRFTKWETLKEKSDALETKLKSVRTALVEGCKSATSLESLKYCSSIGWDNMRKDLPPLENIRPPFVVTPNR